MTYTHLISQRDGAVERLTLNRPDVRNAFNEHVIAELTAWAAEVHAAEAPGNLIYDCRFPRIPDPAAMERALCQRAGIIESGLFLGMARIALVGDDNAVRQLTR